MQLSLCQPSVFILLIKRNKKNFTFKLSLAVISFLPLTHNSLLVLLIPYGLNRSHPPFMEIPAFSQFEL